MVRCPTNSHDGLLTQFFPPIKLQLYVLVANQSARGTEKKILFIVTGGLEGHVSRDCTMEPRAKSCYKCGQAGHISRDCTQTETTNGDAAPALNGDAVPAETVTATSVAA